MLDVQRLATVCGLLLLLGCASPPRVEVDRLPGADFARFKTFAVSAEGAGGDPAYGPSARAAARTALVAALRARGLDPVDDPESADLLVAVRVVADSRLEGGDVFEDDIYVQRQRTGVRTPVGDVPLGEEQRIVHQRGGLRESPSYEVRSRTVVVDIVEAASQRIVWSGTSRQARSREEIDLEDLRERVRAIASQFP